MPIQTSYITGHTSEFNEFRQGVPVHLESGGFLICTAGSSDVVINSKQYSIKRWDLIVAFPYSYAHAIHISDDFNGVIFGVDMSILISAEIENRGFYITAVTENPCISLRPEEAQKILSLREAFLRESAKVDHPLRKEIDESMLKIVIYEIAAFFHHATPNVDHIQSRDDIIFNNFVIQLYSEGLNERSLKSFASREHITPSYLSKVVKRVSNRTASEWISSYTIISIMRLLQNRQLSIATIAEMLNFPNASFLSQYFKKHTAQTPKSYRKEFFERE
ncbi:MAG: helix-turn-helix transcriptional regulator [Rikenellaceae bacterium]